MKRKGLALLLTLCLVLTLLPVLASADSGDVMEYISINDKDRSFLLLRAIAFISTVHLLETMFGRKSPILLIDL